MSSTNTNSSYLPSSVYLPDDKDQQRIHLTELLSLQSKAINRRVIGFLDTNESITGQSWPPASGDPSTKRRDSFIELVEVTIDSAAAPNTNSFPHGLDAQGYFWVKIRGTLNNGSGRGIPLPFPGTDETLIEVTATDVVITNATNAFNGYTGYVTLEYIKS